MNAIYTINEDGTKRTTTSAEVAQSASLNGARVTAKFPKELPDDD